MEENKHFTIDWTNCRLCPRECGADRTRGFGACKVGNTITAARAALHMWEEPCISGDEGSGAVFFSAPMQYMGCGNIVTGKKVIQ